MGHCFNLVFAVLFYFLKEKMSNSEQSKNLDALVLFSGARIRGLLSVGSE